MSSDVIELLVLFALAAVVLYRLKAVIGTRTGHEAPPEFVRRQQEARRAGAKPAPVPDLRPAPGRGRAAARRARERSAASTRSAGSSPDFISTISSQGARGAYEMILMAFEEGDRDTLRALLAPGRLPGLRGGHRRPRSGGAARRGALHRRARGQGGRDRLRSRDADRRHHRPLRRRADHRGARPREPRRRGRSERDPPAERSLDLQPRDGLGRSQLAADRHRRAEAAGRSGGMGWQGQAAAGAGGAPAMGARRRHGQPAARGGVGRSDRPLLPEATDRSAGAPRASVVDGVVDSASFLCRHPAPRPRPRPVRLRGRVTMASLARGGARRTARGGARPAHRRAAAQGCARAGRHASTCTA